jgi:SnoaL-like polyketide cyclase
MASKNVETLRAAHESWNKRDFAGLVKNAAEVLVYTDHSRNFTLNSRDKFREWTEGWAKAFSDGRITNPEYIDAGDVVIAQFTVVGTNDGPFGSLKATGRKMSLPFCEISHFDKTRADCVRRLLLRPIHAAGAARARAAARRRSLSNSTPSQKAFPRAFFLQTPRRIRDPSLTRNA